MNYLIIICTLLIFHTNIFSQDTLITKTDQIIRCKILKEDSAAIFFNFYRDGKSIKTYIVRENIKEIKKISDNPLFSYKPDVLTVGFGSGLDFGGLGMNYTIYPRKKIGLLLGGGASFAGLGYTLGLKFRLIENVNTKTFIPSITMMYGTNTFIWLRNNSEYNSTYSGFTIGFGFDIHSIKDKLGYWSLNLFYPIRDEETNDYINEAKQNGMGFRGELLPVSISAGYHIIITKFK